MDKTQATIADLGALDNRDFIANIQDYPRSGQWAYIEAFRYAALRLAMMQGLVIADSNKQFNHD